MNEQTKKLVEELAQNDVDLEKILDSKIVIELTQDAESLGEALEHLIDGGVDEARAGFVIACIFHQKAFLLVPKPPGMPDDVKIVFHDMGMVPTKTDVQDPAPGAPEEMYR